MRQTFLIAVLFLSVACIAQIHITPYIAEELFQSNPDASAVLESKLNNIVSANGINTQMGESRFVLTGNWVAETKDVVSGAPVQIAYTLNVNLCIGDGESGIKYISETFRAKGVGATEEKACLAAIRSLQTKSAKMSDFVKRGKERIIAYYEENKDNLLSKARSLSATGDYEEAVYQLCLIPQECSYYAEVQDEISRTYQRMVDVQSDALLTEAKSLWASSQNREGASQALDLVTQINPDATCYPDVQQFADAVNAKINLIDERAYATYQKQLKHRQDMEKLQLEAQREQNRLDASVAQTRIKAGAAVAQTLIKADADVAKKRIEAVADVNREREITRRERNMASAALASQAISASERLQSQRISAARDVAVQYVQNRPKTTTYQVSTWL